MSESAHAETTFASPERALARHPAAAQLADALGRGHQVILLCTTPAATRAATLRMLAAQARSRGRTVVEVSAAGACDGVSVAGLGQRMLQALGLEDIAGDDVDILNILRVFLLNECAGGRAPLILLDAAESASPRELTALMQVLKLRHRGTLAVQLVLAGSSALARRLQTPELEPLAARCGEVLDGTLLQPPRLALRRAGRTLSEHVLGIGGRWLLGRDETADIRLDDHWVSRYHALLLYDADGLLLTDLASTNGTRVNGHRIRRSRLADGAECRIGSFRLLLAWPGQAPQRPPAAAAETATMPQLAATTTGTRV
ncbi:MAG: FHA domain-containing protein [Gammaproteobacteria bacterium]|nr:FHA domain-containing protein [Gammaproteobacteria bacterium]TVQ45217.1 MAG: FHA domain-containing protein [Gammaproteobacteria bacterium]